jgi:hypothetical protein
MRLVSALGPAGISPELVAANADRGVQRLGVLTPRRPDGPIRTIGTATAALAGL